MAVLEDWRKIQAFSARELAQWQERLVVMVSLLCRLKYYCGVTVSDTSADRLCLNPKNIIWPVYRFDKIGFYTHRTLDVLGRYKEEDEVYWEVTIQYLQIFVIFVLILFNVRAFLQSLLRTLKNLLRD